MQYLLKFKTWIDYFIELNWSKTILNWIFYWIELVKNNFELNILLNWIGQIILNWIFYWIESGQFSFESKIELNRFWAKFNHWLNRQIVPPRATAGSCWQKTIWTSLPPPHTAWNIQKPNHKTINYRGVAMGGTIWRFNQWLNFAWKWFNSIFDSKENCRKWFNSIFNSKENY